MVTKAVPSSATTIPRVIRLVISSARKSDPQRMPKTGITKVTVVAAVAPFRLSRSKKRIKAEAVQRRPRASRLKIVPAPSACAGLKRMANGRRARVEARRLPAETARGETPGSLILA